MVWLQILATTIVCSAIIADITKNNRQDDKYKTDCNSCALLERKRHWNLKEYKYYCRKNGCFDNKPIFCADYRKRSEEK